MLVSTENFTDIFNNVFTYASVDTETLGLNSFKDDSLFSVQISLLDKDYYLNFLDYPAENVQPLPKEYLKRIKPLLEDSSIIWFLQNAKFDLHMLAKEGIFIRGKIYDLMVLDRLIYNQHPYYNLASITKRWGSFKDDKVMAYITENKLITEINHTSLRKSETKMHFNRVPFSIMQPYGEQDTRSTLDVGLKLLTKIKSEDALMDKGIPLQMEVVENEARLTKTLFRMEQRGIQLNLTYCREALDYYFKILDDLSLEFKELTGLDFVKGTTVFEEVFANEKEKWEKTEKGNWKWDQNILATFEHPAAPIALTYAKAKKQSEYFANFLFYADPNGVLHPDFQQAGTVTGRLSCRDPNLQNLTSPDKYDTVDTNTEELFAVRQALIPREGYFFAMLDYDQVEFRLLLDMCGATNLINEVIGGLDVHQATANLSGTTRKEAKTNNFLTAYGGGVVKLAMGLYETKGSRHQLGYIYKRMFKWGISDAEAAAGPTVTEPLRQYNEPLIRKAYDIQQSIFRSSPEIKNFLKTVQRTAEDRGYVRNWLGRRYYFNDRKFCYTAPNHLVQGGSSEIIKVAMNQVDELLSDKLSGIVSTIHDELIIEVKYGEEDIVPKIKYVMENIYPYRKLPLTVGVEYSYNNLGDKHAWPPPHLSNASGDSV